MIVDDLIKSLSRIKLDGFIILSSFDEGVLAISLIIGLVDVENLSYLCSTADRETVEPVFRSSSSSIEFTVMDHYCI